MQTSHIVSSKELAHLLEIASKLDDPNWEIANWIMDVLGFPPESHHEWNGLSKEEINSGWAKDGLLLCCRDKMHELHRSRPLKREEAFQVLTSWIAATRSVDKKISE